MPENNGNLRWLRKKALIQTSGGNPVYVREGVLYDRTGHIILSVRGDMMDAVEEGNLYCFTQVTLKNYLGKKLTTSKMSVTTVHKSTQDFPTLDEVVFKSYLEEEEIKKMVKPKLSYPKLLNIGLDIFPGCTNSAISPLIYFQEQKLSDAIIAAVPCVQINAALYFIA